MNKFEEKFFIKYIPEGEKLKGVIHQHWLGIINILFLWLSMGALIPSFLYYISPRIHNLIPFYYLEGFLYLVFIKIIYEIFNWYNDVWIITDEGVVELEWALFSTNMKTVKYENIEGVEVEQYGIWDTIFNKGDIVIHKIGDDTFRLYNAIIPYDAVNIIEKFTKEKGEVEEDYENDKFDMIMEALGGVVEDYLDRKGPSSSKKSVENSAKNYLENKKPLEDYDNVVDLR